MNRDQALAKIKKCLALSKSCNSHEAAAAMRQAQKLMTEHMLSPDDVALADVKMMACSTRTNSNPRWEVLLAKFIAEAFGCSTIWTRDGGRYLPNGRVAYTRKVIFYGIASAPEIAGYAWDVLSKQCSRQRLAHIRQQSSRCKPITLTARGDVYAEGWAIGVRDKLDVFANPEKDQLLIEQFKSQQWPDSKTLDPKDRSVGRNVSNNDHYKGVVDGRNAQLNYGVSGAAKQGLLT